VDRLRHGGDRTFAFGADDTETFATSFPALQIAFPLNGTNWRLCGAIAAAADGDLFLLHSGKVGDIRVGVGKSEFVRYALDLEMVDVLWPRGLVPPHFVLRRVGATNCLRVLRSACRLCSPNVQSSLGGCYKSADSGGEFYSVVDFNRHLDRM
jgi:hypothetical protein